MPAAASALRAAAVLGATVAAIGLLILSDRLPLVRHNHDVGHADEAAYALQARGWALSGSPRVPYVSVFFRRYDPGIWRLDDHWPPLLGLVLAPAFAARGVDASVAHAVCVGLGALLLPLAAAALAALACRRVWAGLVAAAAMWLHPLLFGESLRLLGDVLLTALVAAFAAALLAARQRPRALLLAGPLAALACLAKGSQVLLLALLPLLATLVCGVRAWRERRLWLGLLLGLLLLAPGWIATWRAYGHPLHSTQNCVSAFYGIEAWWDRGFYTVHWDRQPPRPRDRFADRARWRAAARANADAFRDALLRRPAGQPWRAAHALGLAWGLLAVAAWPVWAWRAWRRRRRGDEPGASPPAALGAGALLLVLCVFEAGFVITLWSAEQTRLVMPLLPLLAALACLAVQAPVDVVAAAVGRRWPGLRRRAAAVRSLGLWLPCAAALLLAVRSHETLLARQCAATDVAAQPEPRFPPYHAVARALGEAGIGTNAVVMTRNPWELLFYAPVGMRGVGLPYAEPATLLEVARHYRVTHLILDRDRPGLRGFVRRNRAFTRVIDRPFPVYAIDWGLLPPAASAPAM